MSAYIKIDTMEWPRHPGDVQLEHPDWDDSQPLPAGWADLDYPPQPETEIYFRREVQGPILGNDGIWHITYSDPIPMTDEEKVLQDKAIEYDKNRLVYRR